ncbi:MAG: aminotransferase class I/II-fold pyridoxal phosphate-dependent enzyme [Verrucomicrobiota bacterium]
MTSSVQKHGGNFREAALTFGIPESDWIDFSSNLNPFAQEVSAEQWTQWRDEILRYPELNPFTLQKQISTVFEIDLNHLLPTSGGIEAIYLASRLFHGKKVMILDPGFGDYARALESAAVSFDRIDIPSTEWIAPTAEGLRKMTKDHDVVVVGNPNNPTGHAYTRDQILKAKKPNQIWLVDEAFIEFCPHSDDYTFLPILKDDPNLIIVRSLTKCRQIPGLRLGFVATSNSLWMKELKRFQYPWSINGIAQKWAKEFLTLSEKEKLSVHFKKLISLREKQTVQINSIDGLHVYPSVTNFLLIEITDPSQGANFIYRKLGERGILIRTCHSFHVLTPDRFFRIAIRSEEENARLVSALREILPVKSLEAA